MNILSEITVSATDTGLKTFGGPVGDMVTDGSWAVRRDSLKRAVKPPKFIAEQCLQDGRSGPKLDELAPAYPNGIHNDFVALEAQNVLVTEKQLGKTTLLIPLYEVDGDLTVYANAHFIKLIQDMFPSGDWYAVRNEPLKPLMLVEHIGGEPQITAIVMPFQTKAEIPQLRKPTVKKQEQKAS